MKTLLIVWGTILILCLLEGVFYTKNEDEL
jgi:hypothetical protein